MSPPLSLQRSILRAPAPVARAASRMATDAQERWMLLQPRPVRRSYADEVLGSAAPHAEEIWMLRQGDEVRESYVQQVLLTG